MSCESAGAPDFGETGVVGGVPSTTEDVVNVLTTPGSASFVQSYTASGSKFAVSVRLAIPPSFMFSRMSTEGPVNRKYGIPAATFSGPDRWIV